MRRGLRQQRAPHVDPRELILNLCLREQALRVSHFDDARQARLIAGARLRFALLGRRELHRRVGGDGARGLQHRGRRLLLARDRQHALRRTTPSPRGLTPPRQPCAREGW